MQKVEGCPTLMKFMLSKPGRTLHAAGSGPAGWFIFALLAVLLYPVGSAAVEQIEFTNLSRPEVRRELVRRLAERSRARRQAAWQTALSQGWQPRGQRGNTVYELIAIEDDVVYAYKTFNLNAGISAGVDGIRRAAPYDLDGTSQTVGVWDGGAVRVTHQEFGTRVNLKESVDEVDHTTHVAGTIGAAGIQPTALGMAPAVAIDSYDLTDDLSEMTLRAMSDPNEPNALQISNHSYGTVCGWDHINVPPRWYGQWVHRESDMFGQYNSEARDRDDLCYNAPYYLPFAGAGNDRSDLAPSEGAEFEYFRLRLGWVTKTYDSTVDPCDDGWHDGGFDTMVPSAVGKNVMTVGAVNDAVSQQHRDLQKATMTTFSCWGPTDDGRVKPDIVANGAFVFSAAAGSDASYATYSGASMATASASGTAALLIELYGRLFPGRVMRSSTLKGLMIHTADDLGRPGPDYKFGWGLLNATAAADHLRDHHDFPEVCKIAEDVLDSVNTVRICSFFWDGYSSIRATLSWTDPPAPAVSGLDNPSPRLVNDLDIRIIDAAGTTFYPFVLNPEQPDDEATTGDNTLDNVEQIVIRSPQTAGWYTVQIEYKGALVHEQQHYSLMLSGQQSEQTSPADFDGSGSVDLDDLEVLASHWLMYEPSVDIAPNGGDQIIDFLDFTWFASDWHRTSGDQ